MLALTTFPRLGLKTGVSQVVNFLVKLLEGNLKIGSGEDSPLDWDLWMKSKQRVYTT